PAGWEGRSLVTDDLWEKIRLLFPLPRVRDVHAPGRKPLDHRQIFTGILHVLKTGIPWGQLPRELGCGSGTTCQNYLKTWQQMGVWESVLDVLRTEWPEAETISWDRATREPVGPTTLLR